MSGGFRKDVGGRKSRKDGGRQKSGKDLSGKGKYEGCRQKILGRTSAGVNLGSSSIGKNGKDVGR